MGLQAMKVFARDQAKDPLEEAFVLTRLGHPSIIRMFEANEFVLEGTTYSYFTMEYIAEGTLADYLRESDPGNSTRQELCLQIARGLSVAHAQNPPIIHRDLTPWNILVATESSRPTAKISDFGLARQIDIETRLASAAGNYFYMPPEAFWGFESTASDVYSAGIVMFEILTRRVPFPIEISRSAGEEEKQKAVRASRNRQPPGASSLNPELESRWDKFFERVLAYDAKQRIKSGVELEGERRLLTAHRPEGVSDEGLDAERLVMEALEASKQSVLLPQAVRLMEKACEMDQSVRDRYAGLLDLWKRGIVQ